tara:strand:- start:2087 stop:3319 length:1233 start_codon:yes stop_codon:yes gene_type:complete
MGLLRQNHQQHYIGRKEFNGDGTTTIFTVTEEVLAFSNALSVLPGITNERVRLFLDEAQFPQFFTDPSGVIQINYSFGYDIINGWAITFVTAPANGVVIFLDVKVDLLNNDATSGPHVGTVDVVRKYHITSLKDIINNFMIAYTGEDKILSKVNRIDVQFHAMRVLQELSFDTFKSTKSQEVEVPPSLLVPLPHDYVNYVKFSWKDAGGIDHVIYPQSKSSNPKAIKQETNGEYSFDMNDDGVEDTSMLIHPKSSDTWSSFESAGSGSSDLQASQNFQNFQNTGFSSNFGQRYGINAQSSQGNGTFYLDETSGLIHFSSNISGKTITIRYISDSLGTDEEMVVPKLAEEAMYKSMMYAILSTRSNVSENIVQRYKRERFASVRTAKLRLSNIKLEELTQILRGKSKFIKH